MCVEFLLIDEGLYLGSPPTLSAILNTLYSIIGRRLHLDVFVKNGRWKAMEVADINESLKVAATVVEEINNRNEQNQEDLFHESF